MIDPASGEVVLDGESLGPRTSRETFSKLNCARGAELSIENGAHRTYRLARPKTIDRREVAVDLQFLGDRLKVIEIALLDERFGKSWDDWSEANEKARMRAHTEWLRDSFEGKRGRWELPWGVVESTYDPRGGGSSIRIAYP